MNSLEHQPRAGRQMAQNTCGVVRALKNIINIYLLQDYRDRDGALYDQTFSRRSS